MMKKHLLLIVILAAFSIKTKAQTATANDTSNQNKDTKFYPVEVNAEFPGGVEGLYKFIQKNAKNRGCVGRVMVKFVVEKDGSVSNVEVAKSLSADCDAEALRVINKSPKWKPAMQGGHAVRVLWTIPVNFGE